MLEKLQTGDVVHACNVALYLAGIIHDDKSRTM